MARTTTYNVKAGLDTKNYQKGLGDLSRMTTGFINQNVRGFGRMGTAMAASIGIATTAMGTFIAAARKGREEFERIDTLRRRTALAAGGPGQLAFAGAQGSRVAQQFGINESLVQPAFYDALAVTNTQKEAVDLLELAAKNWWLSGTSMQVTAKTFKDNADLFDLSTAEYADATTAITQFSKLTPAEVAQFAPYFLGRGTGLGIGLSEQLSMFGSAAARFRPEQASTRLGEFYNALADPNHKLTKAFIEFTGHVPALSEDLVGELRSLRANLGETDFAAIATGSVGDIAKVLTEGTVYDTILTKMSGDITGIFDRQANFLMESEERRHRSIQETINDIWREIGETSAGPLNDFSEQMALLARDALPNVISAMELLGTAARGTNTVFNWLKDRGNDIKNAISGGRDVQQDRSWGYTTLDETITSALAAAGNAPGYDQWAARITGSEAGRKFLDEYLEDVMSLTSEDAPGVYATTGTSGFDSEWVASRLSRGGNARLTAELLRLGGMSSDQVRGRFSGTGNMWSGFDGRAGFSAVHDEMVKLEEQELNMSENIKKMTDRTDELLSVARQALGIETETAENTRAMADCTVAAGTSYGWLNVMETAS